MSTRKKKDPEQVLLAYWQKKLGPEHAQNSTWVHVTQCLELDGVKYFADTKDGMQSERSAVSRLIWDGYPLNRSQYYFALACGLLMGDHPYLEFFKHRWHETKDSQGYGPDPKTGKKT